MKPEFVLPDIHPLIKWKLIRAARDADLLASDYAAMPDYPMADKDRPAFVTYRQGLRDIPDQGANPYAVAWPQKPAFLK